MSNPPIDIPVVNGEHHHLGNPGGSDLSEKLTEPFMCVEGLVNPEELLKQIQELIEENSDLKEVMKKTNHAMKDRLEELSLWREKQREECDLLEQRFQEAKQSIISLTAENEELKRQIQALSQQNCQGVPFADPVVYMEVEDQGMEQLKALNLRLQAEKADLLAIISELQLRLASLSTEDSFVEIPMMTGEEAGGLRADKDPAPGHIGASGHKYEYTEKHMRSEELTVSQLLHLLQEKSQKEESLHQELRTANDRVLFLEKKASKLSENETQTEWAEEDQEKEKAASQASQKVDELKAQVAALQKEGQDFQVQLNATEQMKKALEKKCQGLEAKAEENLSQLEEKQQLQYDNQKLALQVESMHSEIKLEQTKTAVEKKRLAELQLVYDQSCDDNNKTIQELKSRQAEMEERYNSAVSDLSAKLKLAENHVTKKQEEINEMSDTITKKEQEMATLSCTRTQLEETYKTAVSDLSKKLELAENALAKKQDQIDGMLDTISKNEEELETLALMKTQMEIYCADFHAEREAREKIHEEKERLGVQLEFLVKENSKLKEDLDNFGRQSLAHMQQRHGAAPAGNQDQGPRVVHRGPDSRDWQHQVNIPDHACPKCGEILPDIDTLQIHVMDCII